MENAKSMANRVREVFLDGKWIANTNYKDLLSDITWKQATTHIGSLNTIAALTYHLDYYLGGVLKVLEGGVLEIRDKYSFELPPISSEEDWDRLRTGLRTNAEKFAKQVELMTSEKLADTFVDEKYGTYRRNIEGMIEHAYYHLGQISLIKKMILESATG